MILQTSEQWYKEFRKNSRQVIWDPDGWDRKNFNFAWNDELITWQEFKRRLKLSTLYKVDA